MVVVFIRWSSKSWGLNMVILSTKSVSYLASSIPLNYWKYTPQLRNIESIEHPDLYRPSWREKRWEEGAPGRSIQMTKYMSKRISHFTRSRGDPVTSPYPLSTPLREEVFEIEWSVEGESSAAHSWLIFETALPNLGVWVDIFSITISIVILSFSLGYYPWGLCRGNQ